MHAEDKTKRCCAISIIGEYWVDKGCSNYVEVAASSKGFSKARAAEGLTLMWGVGDERASLSLSLSWRPPSSVVI